jgi:hypothetical protein
MTTCDNNEKIILKATINIDIIKNIYSSRFGDCSEMIFPRFLVGKNAINNWEIYKASNQTDTIFHLDKFSSPYVIINIPITDLTKELIYIASILCKSKSKYKTLPNIGVLYTSISNTILGIKEGSFIINSNHKKNITTI